MKFTIERAILIRMLEKARGGFWRRSERNCGIRLSACDARVFITGPLTTAGHEALVFEDGECHVKAKTLLQVLRTFPHRKHITIEANERGLHIDNFTMPVNHFGSVTFAPDVFQVFPVTDLRVVPPDAPKARPG